jgi:hypothetical protein
MWWTQNGNRVLEPKESILFAESLLDLLEDFNLSDNDDYPLGITAFDRLTYGQKISVLSTVANGLLRTDAPMVTLTAALEAAIAAVFEHLRNMIIIEIDDEQPQTYWRQIVIAARKEAQGEEIPAPDCDDLKEWDIELECVEEGILWDADYEIEHLYADRSPAEARELRQMTGITDEYFNYIPEDPKDEEIKSKLSELRKLCESVMKGYNNA